MNKLEEEIKKTEDLDNNKENRDKKGKHKKGKNKKERKNHKIIKRFLVAFCFLFALGCITLTLLLYGPYSGFRDWLITTSMTTMTHQWIAQIFYDEDTIESVLARNRVDEIDEETDTSAIVIEEKVTYANEYEKAILEKENKEDKYKIIEISGKGYTGYLVAVYDPSKIHTLVTSKMGVSGQYLTTMAQNNKAIVAINGGGFEDPNYNSNGSTPLGVTYSKGKLITSSYYGNSGGIIGFDKEDKLVLSSKCTKASAESLQIRDAVSCGPFLITNGKASKVVGNGGWGTAPRTAIAQRQDGIVLFLIIDGRMIGRQGADMDDLIEILERYGAYNAANLDGGTSTALVVNYELINDPIDSTGKHKTRPIATGFGLIDE